MKVIFELDSENDEETLKNMLKANDMSLDLFEIYYLARNRLKHGDNNISESDVKLLEEIMEYSGKNI